MPTCKVKAFLDGHGVKYITLQHSAAYTAQEIAARAHIPGKELAKTVMVKLDGRMAMAVLPASCRVDFSTLARTTGSEKAELAGEAEFKNLFPECELGAMPPFGNLYGMEVYVARRLAEDEEIAFNAGTHRELFRMRYDDYARLVQPLTVSFAL